MTLGLRGFFKKKRGFKNPLWNNDTGFRNPMHSGRCRTLNLLPKTEGDYPHIMTPELLEGFRV